MIQDSGDFCGFVPYEMEDSNETYFNLIFNRNSGFTFGKAGKVVLAIRSTHGLEVPLTDDQGGTKYTIYFENCIETAFIFFFQAICWWIRNM